MKIIIDAYNVLKQRGSSEHVCEHERRAFINELARYAAQSKNSVIVVFDGGDQVYPYRFEKNGIMVVYSGHKKTADDIIVDELDASYTDDTIVVTTDRFLCDYANEQGIPSMDSHNFSQFVAEKNGVKKKQQVSSSGVEKRPGHTSSSELDALMIAGAEKMLDKDAGRRPKANAVDNQKKSKHERRLEKIVKKL